MNTEKIPNWEKGDYLIPRIAGYAICSVAFAAVSTYTGIATFQEPTIAGVSAFFLSGLLTASSITDYVQTNRLYRKLIYS